MKIVFSSIVFIATSLFFEGSRAIDDGISPALIQQALSSSDQVSQSSPTQCTDQSAVQYAKNFYREHYYFFAEREPQMVNQLYSDEFKAVITNHAECFGDDGLCNLHFDPWLDAQDGYADGEVDFSTQIINKDTILVDLTYQFRIHSTLPASSQTVSLLLQRADTPLCWKMDDMLLSDPVRTSMKAIMKGGYEHYFYYQKSLLSWKLLSTDWYSSKIAVIRDNQRIAEYDLYCDMTEALTPVPEQLDGEKNKVGLVVTHSNPQGLVVISCRSGVHSKQLSVYDLESKSQQPVWEETGSYYGEWSINQHYDLVLSYDEPCRKLNCLSRFVQKDVIWGSIP
ncbi:MAG: hypothetical protein ACI9YO_003298 [Gammaproteobacteria bacterium]|jgi:hypothetical protein